MGDCSNHGMRPQGRDVMRIRAEFDGPDTDFPWVYPLALNGRALKRLTVDGVEYRPTILSRFKRMVGRITSRGAS